MIMNSISVIMPALNEEDNLGRSIKDSLDTFDSLRIDGEIVVVNDGSTDNTQAVIEKYLSANPTRIKTLRHASPEGIGASFWDGIRKAGKSAVVMLPGDGENSAFEILRYLGLMEHVDIVVPYVANRGVRPLYRNVLSGLFLFVINMTFGLYLNYTNGTIIYKKNILENTECHENGFFFQVEALIKAIKKGCLFAEVPYSISKRESGVSKAVSIKSFVNIAIGYIRLVKDIYFTGRK